METDYEKSLALLSKFLKETSPEDVQKIIDVLNQPKVTEQKSKTDYDLFYDTLVTKLGWDGLEEEQFECADKDEPKQAIWNIQYYGVPKNITNGTFLGLRKYNLYFDDNGNYVGYVHNMEKYGFVPETTCSVINELKNLK